MHEAAIWAIVDGVMCLLLFIVVYCRLLLVIVGYCCLALIFEKEQFLR